MLKDNETQSVALIPDRFASYRYTVFKRLSDFKENEFYLTIYADTEEDIPGLKLTDSRYCDRDYLNGGISWVRIRNFAMRGICFWQSGLLRLACSKEHDVHVYWGEAHRLSTWASVIISRLTGKQVVFWTHGIYGNEGFIKRHIRVLFYRMADALLLYSDYGKRVLVEHGFKPSNLYVIKNSLDSRLQNEHYNSSLESVGRVKLQYFSEQDRVIVFVGRIEPQKRLNLLLDVLSKLKAKGGQSYKLLLIGDGSHSAELIELARHYDLDEDVHFYGACYDDEILAPLIMMADVCVSPGEVGLTAMHSLIYGTPVITHDNFSEQMPEFEVIVLQKSGAFYRFDDVGDLCSKVEEVVTLVDRDVITSETCRACVLEHYTEEYQLQIFKEMLIGLNH
jgi:glycosyltransferase involved in cell wall biosynthesis